MKNKFTRLKKKEKLSTYEKMMLIISISTSLGFWLNVILTHFIK
jgi:hypothetical protein